MKTPARCPIPSTTSGATTSPMKTARSKFLRQLRARPPSGRGAQRRDLRNFLHHCPELPLRRLGMQAVPSTTSANRVLRLQPKCSSRHGGRRCPHPVRLASTNTTTPRTPRPHPRVADTTPPRRICEHAIPSPAGQSAAGGGHTLYVHYDGFD